MKKSKKIEVTFLVPCGGHLEFYEVGKTYLINEYTAKKFIASGICKAIEKSK